MDTGEDFAFVAPQLLRSTPLPTRLVLQTRHVVDEAQSNIGMPWTESILPGSQDLTFMPFWEHQMNFMKSHLTNLEAMPVTNKDGTEDFSVTVGKDNNVRVANMCFSSSQFRKIRMTYYDAGPQAQVFNSLWYPAPEYNLPMLGIDLIQFHGGKKHLAVVDFQPIQQEEEQHAATYEHLMEPIRNQYPSLQGKMSKRFYDENQFFSKQMLFARFEDEATVTDSLAPAFEQYLETYMGLMNSQDSGDSEGASQVLERHAAYDVYSAHRDPALHMFKAKFGEKWADEFVHEFLFDLSR
jgi:15,16-dihydrobiliverdin:ferredoxin oxidoreductase